jgi:phosphatidate cytidylyltransferase
MKKLVQRLLMFFIGLPLVVFLVVFLPQRNHLVINIIIIILSALGALEFAAMLKKKGCRIHPAEALILGALGPIAMTLMVSFNIGGQVIPAVFILGASWCLLSRVFSAAAGLTGAINHVSAGFSVMLYPGLFMAWIIRMTLFPYSNMVILMFLLMVFANDSAAWAVGMLFGKGNRGVIPASPQKSVAGFIGGFAASVLVGVGAVRYIPTAFISAWLHPAAAGIIIGIFSGAAAAMGDLAESALKRSSDIKDSGAIMPGRGGVLDSIDSIALAAPVYYALYWILFG